MTDTTLEREDETAARSRLRPTIYGAMAGGLFGLVLLAFFGGRYAIGSVDAVLLDPTGSRARAEFVVSSGGLYALTVVAAVIGGIAVAAVVYAFGREAEPESRKFGLRWLLPVAAIAAAVFAYGVLRAGLGALGDIEAGVVTISVFRMTLIATVAGLIGGGVTANVVDALARPDTLGIEGEAVPESLGSFMKEMTNAVGTPMMAILILAVFAIGLSQLLLAFHNTAVAVAAFSIAGALVLGAVTLLAYEPWDRGRSRR